MKNNYAFGGNNCCMVISTRPGTVPVTHYSPKRVAITGAGAVTAIGHTVSDILHNIWQRSATGTLGGVKFPQDILTEARELLGFWRKPTN